MQALLLALELSFSDRACVCPQLVKMRRTVAIAFKSVYCNHLMPALSPAFLPLSSSSSMHAREVVARACPLPLT